MAAPTRAAIYGFESSNYGFESKQSTSIAAMAAPTRTPTMSQLPTALARAWMLTLLLGACTNNAAAELADGDIIFHTSRSGQSLAIQHATGSRYSHMGLVFFRSGKAFVFEAVQPVSYTPLDRWIARGDGGHYVVRRLKNASSVLTPEALAHMQKLARGWLGRPYDSSFEWSDQRMYCSEIVWKLYQRVLGIELGALQPLRDFDLRDPLVQAKMRERYGSKVPWEMRAISPAAVFASEHLQTVAQE